MFTGIIQAVGEIVEVAAITNLETQATGDVRLTVDAGALDLSSVKIGDSIAINGACMTVVACKAPLFWVDVSAESLRVTTGLNRCTKVNLEKALCVGDSLGGHIVSGHIDGLGYVTKLEDLGSSHVLVIEVPRDLAPFVAIKGSIVINGVSLTTNLVMDFDRSHQETLLPALVHTTEVSINLIPHTWQQTTLNALVIGDAVNVEIDLLARYLQRNARFM